MGRTIKRRAARLLLPFLTLASGAWAQEPPRFEEAARITTTPVGAVALSANGAWLAYATNTEIAVAEFSPGAAEPARRTLAPLRDVRALAFVGDPPLLWAATGDDGRLRLYGPRDGHLIEEQRPHRRQMTGLAADRDGRRLVTVARSGWVRVTDLDERSDRFHREIDRDHYVKLDLSPDGRWLVMGGSTSGPMDSYVIRLWDLQTDQKAPIHPMRFREVDAVAVSPDGRLAAYASGRTVEAFRRDGDSEWKPALQRTEEREVKTLAFSPNGRYLAAGGAPDRLYLYDAATGEPALSLDSGPRETTAVVFSGDGRMLAAAGAGGTRAWRIDPPLSPPPDESGQAPVRTWIVLLAGQAEPMAGLEGLLRERPGVRVVRPDPAGGPSWRAVVASLAPAGPLDGAVLVYLVQGDLPAGLSLEPNGGWLDTPATEVLLVDRDAVPAVAAPAGGAPAVCSPGIAAALERLLRQGGPITLGDLAREAGAQVRGPETAAGLEVIPP